MKYEMTDLVVWQNLHLMAHRAAHVLQTLGLASPPKGSRSGLWTQVLDDLEDAIVHLVENRRHTSTQTGFIRVERDKAMGYTVLLDLGNIAPVEPAGKE